MIFLVKIDLINVLPEFCKSVAIPDAVIHEISCHKDEASEWIEQNKEKYGVCVLNIPPLISAWDLGKGETEVITYAHQNDDFIVALDDRAARNCAMSLRISVIGTLGLILKARKANMIPDVKPYLGKLLDSGYRISNGLIDYALKLAGN